MCRMILVSIVIPIYKVEQYIIRCIESVLSQTYRQLEVVMVDDCSPDQSLEIAKKYIQNSPKGRDLLYKYHRHECNRGQAAARNTGVKIATGDYLFFLDSDDEITTNCIESLLCESENGHYDAVCGDVKVVGNNPLFSFNHQVGSYNITHEIVKAYVDRNIYMVIWNKLLRSEIVKGILFKEVAKHEDELWSFTLVNSLSSLKNVKECTYIYYVRPDSVSTQGVTIVNYYSLIDILKDMVELYNSGKITSFKENFSYIQEKRISWMSAVLRSRLKLYDKWLLFIRFYNLPIGRNGFFLKNLLSMQVNHFLYPYRRSLSLKIRILMNNRGE